MQVQAFMSNRKKRKSFLNRDANTCFMHKTSFMNFHSIDLHVIEKEFFCCVFVHDGKSNV